MAGNQSNLPKAPTQLPRLLLPHDGISSSDDRLSAVELLSGIHREFRPQEPVGRGWRCRGSSHGWLVMLDKSPKVVILNPLTFAKRILPPLHKLPPVTDFDGREYNLDPDYRGPFRPCTLKAMRDLVVKKIILSDCPVRNPNFTTLMILYSGYGTAFSNIACCKSGQDSWTLIPFADADDAVFIDGAVYAVDIKGSIFQYDVSCNPPRVFAKKEMIKSPEGDARYLVPVPVPVRALGALLLVCRFFDDDALDNHGTYKTRDFKVYSLYVSENKWERVRDLGDLALFVGGHSCSSAVRASEFPGCISNSIYYTDDDGQMQYPEGVPEEHDVGRFCLDGDGHIYDLPCNFKARVSGRPNPTWFTPNA